MSHNRNTFRPKLECLEGRQLLAVDAFIYFGAFIHRPTSTADTIEIAPTGWNQITNRGGWDQVTNLRRASAFEIKDFSFGVENPTTIGARQSRETHGRAPV